MPAIAQHGGGGDGDAEQARQLEGRDNADDDGQGRKGCGFQRHGQTLDHIGAVARDRGVGHRLHRTEARAGVELGDHHDGRRDQQADDAGPEQVHRLDQQPARRLDRAGQQGIDHPPDRRDRQDARHDQPLIERPHDVAALAQTDEEGADDRGHDADAADRQRQQHHHFDIGLVAEEDGRQDHGRHGRDGIGLEQVGSHAGAVADVVTDVVGDHRRVARVILGNPGFDLADQVGTYVRALGEDAAAQPREDRDQRGAEGKGHQAVDDRAAGAFKAHPLRHEGVVAGHAQQAEAGHQHAGDGARPEGQVQPLGQAFRRRLGHALHARAAARRLADDLDAGHGAAPDQGRGRADQAGAQGRRVQRQPGVRQDEGRAVPGLDQGVAQIGLLGPHRLDSVAGPQMQLQHDEDVVAHPSVGDDRQPHARQVQEGGGGRGLLAGLHASGHRRGGFRCLVVGPADAGRGDLRAEVADKRALALDHPADAGQAQVAAFGLAAQDVLGAGRDGQDHLVVVAAGGQQFERPLSIHAAVQPGLGRRRHGQDLQIQLDADLAGLGDVAGVGQQAVGDIGAGGGQTPHDRGELDARHGGAIGGLQRVHALRLQRQRALRRLQSQPAVADGAGDEDQIAGPRACPADGRGRRSPAQHGGREAGRPRRLDRVAAQQGNVEDGLIAPQAGDKGLALGPAAAFGPVAGQQIAEGLGPLGGQIGQVHAQQLLRHRVQRVVGQEVDALDDGVLGQNQIMPRTRGQHGHVVGQPPRPFRVRQRLQKPLDSLEFASDINRGHRVPRRRAPRSRTSPLLRRRRPWPARHTRRSRFHAGRRP
uniref:LigA n=1 Tax=Parastrongyloides trichosuri TaxID=131310 RepID=A0A0N4ZJ01_PARTI